MVKAVDGISFDVRRGEVLAIVGESGSGKSVTSLSIMGLLEVPPAKIEADVAWKGENLLAASEKRMRQIRGGEIAMIFQDPLTAMNPVQTVGRQVAEMARIHDEAEQEGGVGRGPSRCSASSASRSPSSGRRCTPTSSRAACASGR